jgi:hypothetical protein
MNIENHALSRYENLVVLVVFIAALYFMCTVASAVSFYIYFIYSYTYFNDEMIVDLEEEERPPWFKPDDTDIGPTIHSRDISEGHWPFSVKVKGTQIYCEGPLCIRIAEEALQKLKHKRIKSGESQPTIDDVRRTRAKKECACNHRNYCDHCMIWHALSAEGKLKVKKMMEDDLKRRSAQELAAKLTKL